MGACRWPVSLWHCSRCYVLREMSAVVVLTDTSTLHPPPVIRHAFCPSFGGLLHYNRADSALFRAGIMVGDLRRSFDSLLYRIDGSCQDLSGSPQQRKLLPQFSLHGHWCSNSRVECRLNSVGERGSQATILKTPFLSSFVNERAAMKQFQSFR